MDFGFAKAASFPTRRCRNQNSKERNATCSGLFSFTPVLAADEAGTYAEFLHGVAEVGIAKRKRIVYEPVQSGEPRHPGFWNSIQVDGRLLIGRVDEAILEQFEPEGVPVVAVEGGRVSRLPVRCMQTGCAGRQPLNR